MSDIAVKRALTAIVIADVVGYSRLMGEDEAGTLRRLTHCREKVVAPTVAAWRGRMVNVAGDSMLMEFPSVVDATHCAMAIQRALHAENANLAENRRLELRIGVNIGEVITKGGAIFGDSVNIAARLQALAEPGGVCLSSAACEQVRGRIDADFIAMGAHQVKNIARPIEVFALDADAIANASPPPAPRAGQARRRAIAAGLVFVAAATAAALYVRSRPGGSPIGERLGAFLSEAEPRMGERARASLVKEFLGAGKHRALAIARNAGSHSWTAGWPTPEEARDRALERCQFVYNEVCEPVVINDEFTAPPGGKSEPRDMERVRYDGAFDPARIPMVRAAVSTRADVVAYAKASGPKAAAIHSLGVFTIVTGAATQRRAELQALKACNDAASKRDVDGPCYLYAIGDKVVLPARGTTAATKQ